MASAFARWQTVTNRVGGGDLYRRVITIFGLSKRIAVLRSWRGQEHEIRLATIIAALLAMPLYIFAPWPQAAVWAGSGSDPDRSDASAASAAPSPPAARLTSAKAPDASAMAESEKAAPKATPTPDATSQGKSGGSPTSFNLFSSQKYHFTFIPVPEIATDPFAGTTVGVLPVFLFTNAQHQVDRIFAPDINYNTIMGAGGNFRYMAYPSMDKQYYFIAGGAQNISRTVDVLYSTGRSRYDRWSFDGRIFYEKDPTERFFGIGNTTIKDNQTNFTQQQFFADARLGYNFNHNYQIAIESRPRYVRIGQGALQDQMPFIGTLFPNLKGLNGGTDFLNRMILSYDSRDNINIPREGTTVRLLGGFSNRGLMSSFSYTQFAAMLKHYTPLGSRVVLASHAFIEYEPAGGEMDFWAMSRLGGYNSLLTTEETLRGYGTGRFVANNLTVFNIEARTRVYERDIFDTHGIIELAPFLEAGKVFQDVSDNPVNRLHPVGGLGVRGVAEPYVVGYVDVGWGSEGAAVFSGVNYPF